MTELGRWLIFFGLILAAAGALLMLGAKIPGIGRLPGDLVYRGRNTTVYFPIVTSLLLSVVLSLLLWLVAHFRR